MSTQDKKLMYNSKPAHKPYLVWLIFGLSCIPYLIFQQQGLEEITLWFVPTEMSQLFSPFAPWRLWTPTFVHYTLPHLATNLYLWWLFASQIEADSRLELSIIFIFSAAAANGLQWYLAGPNFGGLSGLVYALMAYLYLMRRFAGKQSYHIDPNLCLFMLALIPLLATGWLGTYSNYAHIAGLVSGALLAGVYLAIIAFISNDTTKDTKKNTSNE